MKNYFAPEVEILDVMVEQGFAASQNGPSIEDGGIVIPGFEDED